MRKKTNNEFLQELKEKNPYVMTLNEYNGANTKLGCNCLICDFDWEATPHNLLHGKGCPNCAGNIRLTNEQFLEQLFVITDNVLPLEEYINTHTKILCRCLICEKEWNVEPSKLLNGRGCPVCANHNRRKGVYKITEEEFKDKIASLGFSTDDEYQGTSVAINFTCNKCEYKFHTTPYRLIFNGSGCKNCYNISLRKTNEQFKAELALVNPDIEPLDEYINSHTRIDYKCKVCGLTHNALPTNLLRGYGCPNCYSSKGEKQCKKYFDEHQIYYIPQYEFNDLKGVGGKNLRFDFAVINNGNLLLVEYDGIFHYEQQYENDGSDIVKIHDNLKNEYCKNNNIPLLRIPYWEFENIDNILKENLKSIF